jgi:tRNA (cytidine/uridine-2'-O-)-methyltransferase
MTHYKANFVPKIALYEPDIPQNTAAIIRTCACLGAELEIIEPCGFLISDKRFKRVVMDYMDDKKIKIYQSSEDFFKAKSDQRVILITTKAKKIYTDFKFKINDTLLFGKESAGVPNKVHKILKQKIKIPMIAKKKITKSINIGCYNT